MIEVPLSDGSGVLHRYTDLRPVGGERRFVDVWLPPSYADRSQRYPVLYMHDGQNLFDPAVANTGVDWGIDEAIVRLMRDTGHPGAIVVGVWHGSQRWRDYMPQAAWAALEAQGVPTPYPIRADGPPWSDDYLQFLVADVKPLVDAVYRTLPDRLHTFVMGSSMGGLISLYALEEYPEVFGAAGCLSTHWPAGGNALVDFLAARLPAPGRHRLYFDYGTATLDAEYEPYQRRMDEHLRRAGYAEGRDWITLRFDGAEHNEAAWRARLDVPVRFLLRDGSR